jgi:hypothetical protein
MSFLAERSTADMAGTLATSITGGDIFRESEVNMVAAVNALHHGPAQPSRLVLPIIDRDAAR